MKHKARTPLANRLWPFVEQQAANTCWLWTRKRNKIGWYGAIYWQNKRLLAHRVAWELTFGSIPSGKKVLHKCDNPICVNPSHLFLGTQADNVQDMRTKGRMSGLENLKLRQQIKVPAKTVKWLRTLLPLELPRKSHMAFWEAIGKCLGVKGATVYALAHGYKRNNPEGEAGK